MKPRYRVTLTERERQELETLKTGRLIGASPILKHCETALPPGRMTGTTGNRI
jgi:hypothetical protein